MMDTVSQDVIAILREKLPDFFPRSRVGELTNGLFAKQTLCNLNREGKGPRVHRMGRQVCYIRDEFVDWLIKHCRGMTHEHSGTGTEVH